LDISKFKLEIYDLLGLILPGLIAISEGWIFLRGWTHFIVSLNQLGGTGLTVLLLFAFAMGNLIQELGDLVVKTLKGPRFFKRARDKFWTTEEGRTVKEAIRERSGSEIHSVDTAFDYCLTSLKRTFAKRDVFIATSDLCRSLSMLCILAIVPILKSALRSGVFDRHRIVLTAMQIALPVSLAALSWRRMVRFRDLSDTTVFRAYLTTLEKNN
jgi:hypothetical protein